MTATREFVCAAASDTAALGAALGRVLRVGDCVALCGPLGAGKTQFTKGIALGLGVSSAEPVVSPTFVLIREYEGRVPLIHIDVYRLSQARELLDLGFDEIRRDAVAVIEWADRVVPAIPADSCWVELEYADGGARRILVRWDEARLCELRSPGGEDCV